MAKTKFTPVFEEGRWLSPNDPALKVPVHPIVYEDRQYELPLLKPQTREEAIFLLARCGFNALAVPAHLIRAFSYVFSYRKQIQKNGHAIIASLNAPRKKWCRTNTNTLVQRWIVEKPAIFSGLSKMAGWLHHACCLVEGTATFTRRCTQKHEYVSIARRAYKNLSPSSLAKLADELDEISDSCNRRWTLYTYLRLVLQYAELVEKSSGRNASDSTLKSKLRKKLRENELYYVHFPRFLEASYEEWDLDEDADIYVNGIRESFEDGNITFVNVIASIQEKLGIQPNLPGKGKAPELASDTNRQINAPLDAPHEGVDSSSDQLVEEFLDSNQRFNLEFFMMFCIAYVEVNLADKEDPTVAPKKITNWMIYEKMRELNNGKDIAPIGHNSKNNEKNNRVQVGNRISHCKARLRKFKLPAHDGDSSLTKEETIECIQFFQKVKKLSKYFALTTFAQQAIMQMDAQTTKN